MKARPQLRGQDEGALPCQMQTLCSPPDSVKRPWFCTVPTLLLLMLRHYGAQVSRVVPVDQCLLVHAVDGHRTVGHAS